MMILSFWFLRGRNKNLKPWIHSGLLFFFSWWWRCGIQSFSHVQFFVTPRTVALQTLLSVGFSRQEYWSGLPFPSPGGFPDPETEPVSGRLLHWQVGSLPLAPPGEPTNSVDSNVPRFWHCLSLHYYTCWSILYLHRLFQYPPNCFPCFLPELL